MLPLPGGARSLVLTEKSAVFSSPLVHRRQAPQPPASGRYCLFQPPMVVVFRKTQLWGDICCTDAFKLWRWRRLLRVPWTARRANQSILKEINPGISLEGMTLKRKLQSFEGYTRCENDYQYLLRDCVHAKSLPSCPTLTTLCRSGTSRNLI